MILKAEEGRLIGSSRCWWQAYHSRRFQSTCLEEGLQWPAKLTTAVEAHPHSIIVCDFKAVKPAPLATEETASWREVERWLR